MPPWSSHTAEAKGRGRSQKKQMRAGPNSYSRVAACIALLCTGEQAARARVRVNVVVCSLERNSTICMLAQRVHTVAYAPCSNEALLLPSPAMGDGCASLTRVFSSSCMHQLSQPELKWGRRNSTPDSTLRVYQLDRTSQSSCHSKEVIRKETIAPLLPGRMQVGSF
jgi:hypothetical protein